MAEVWKPVVGYEGLYDVSSDGRIRSLDRRVTRKCRWGGYVTAAMKGRVLSPSKYGNGYHGVHLRPGTGARLVHRLVAAAFVPGDSSLQVNHKNGIRDDNRAENLEWLSCSDNHRHSYAKLNRKQHALQTAVMFGSPHSLRVFPSVLAASKVLGISAGSISSAVLRKHRCLGKDVAYV